MPCKLISYSTPSEELLAEGLENIQDLVAFCARVSNPANQYNKETSEKLIAYLIKNKHWSPLEHAFVTIEIETTRDIARQILRHRSFCFQEMSQRYQDATDILGFNTREARLQDHKNRQNSIEVENNPLQEEWSKRQQAVIDLSKQNYDWAVNNGIAKEQARVVLPEGNTVSRLYMSGTIRSWIHYFEVRLDKATQKEHREVAEECAKIITKIFPYAKILLDKA
jgi:thymidylate synthase (FAD)